jgi:hypothetical protein
MLGWIPLLTTIYENEPHGSKVILELIALSSQSEYRMISDNWFSSPDLYSKLYSKQTDTLRQSKECLSK